MSRLFDKYKKEVMPALQKEFSIKNTMAVPRLEKIILNVGVGDAIQNIKFLDTAKKELSFITGQWAATGRAKKSISTFKLRKGHAIACYVTLRGKRMYEFFDRLVNIVLPRVRDFRGVSPRSFDGRGNYTLGMKDQLVFPEELSWVPLIESGFQVRAYSRARALGPWQFISSTGYRYGLKRDRWIDERMDPIKSTQAALKYLNDLHSHFGDWTTALAAYNCGEYKVKTVIRNQRFNYLDNFWDLYLMLPRETASFVPRFIATLLIVNDPEKYGFNLPTPDTPLEFVRLPMNSPIRLSSLSKAMGLKEDVLSSLNSELRHGATPGYEYVLRVPLGFAEKAMIALNTLPTWIPSEATYRIHRVQRGESLSLIAQRYRTSISAIARLNRLSRVDLIKSGQSLKIPVSGRSYASSPPPKLVKEGEKLIYIVRRGDSLYKIASAFSTTVGEIKKDNNLESDTLDVGQKIVIQSSIPQGATIYTVKRGDNPSGIANKFGMNLSILLSLNSLNYRSKIYPGQELWVVTKKQGSN